MHTLNAEPRIAFRVQASHLGIERVGAISRAANVAGPGQITAIEPYGGIGPVDAADQQARAGRVAYHHLESRFTATFYLLPRNDANTFVNPRQ
ncbi:MAG: hypothetical protein VX745_03955 [Pseudomonadota bacterium]|nr:hypothetical protein [Pseudomonadota bacterium]